MLKGIALHKVPLAEADPWLDHFSSCSPCFQEFTQFRKQAVDGRRRAQLWLAAAAVLLFAVAGWLWVATRPSVQTSATVVLDLRERSVARGENSADTKQLALEIPRTAKHLVIDLPIGSKEGNYDLALLNEAGDELSRATGIARLEDHIVTLRADIDIRNLNPGLYFLGLRQPGPEWSRYPTRVN
jgi:multidrug efflux pump subunit AcrA (membrane-fusion protein)